MRDEFDKNKSLYEEEINELVNEKLRKIFEENFNKVDEKKLKPEIHKPLPNIKHHPHLEPTKLDLNFDADIDTLITVFDDESTAHAVIKSLKSSPMEIQVLAKLIIDLHRKFYDSLGE